MTGSVPYGQSNDRSNTIASKSVFRNRRVKADGS